VPVDYAHPAGPSLPLAVAEIPASGPGSPLGDLVFNPGGPGESGVGLLPVIAGSLPKAVTERFTVVGFDERGTGASSRLACGPSPSAAASVDPLPAAVGGALPAAALYRDMATSCAAADPGLAGHVDTLDAARDLDRLRQALGQAKLTFLGLSYGTLLGAAYAQLYPTRVGAMVLDGAVVPGMSLAADAVAEAPALEASLDHFFSTCAAQPACALGPDPAASWDALARELAAQPLPGGAGDPPVTVGTLDTATLYYLSVPRFAGGYPTAVEDALHGNGGPLASMALGFFTDLDGSSLVGPLWSYTCEDTASHPTAAAATALAVRLQQHDPRLGAEAVTYNLGGCIGWSGPSHPVRAGRAAGAPPILVIGNRGDPNTPFSGAVQLAHQLSSGRLVEWDGWGHTWLLNGPGDACMDGIVIAYLDRSTPPPTGTVCR
jgi:pimeloyl-ACP methyl ester carboxylesterase